ncbi:phosphoadenosine phosphosulfate reductase family protein [Clostridium perfringens]|uniref:Phosphoadenosine phosphosulfate reductase family protein n=1 Tax=Clostridium perfringens TaxID=1502 RepID=A0A133MX02_CLOPF|nr:phosphoadenosine phosphosulfate reductase family protein [Clostridium perfringens]KXA08556.1 phosphoadenosine phosphosulfate reductase family protein [Clostridium perfringens]MDG6886708.1 Phosphoadenosine phosphosulfate reductase [Clostridium perfringens]MDM0450943.1 phosphoadenosine phosphosulfate reductase family protein [Clostridium perfringens]MDM1000419.1 phosphoadenosine phosphosulfate reductase family protein [Clostridium perfringens]HAT4280271.1 phosphoadenosine phosphosulfate reduc
MINYVCEKCNLECSTSTCPICNERTIGKSKIFWCKNCNIPTYDEICTCCGGKGNYISTDIRPVFPEERLLLEVLIGEPFKFSKCSVWNGQGNRYIVDGKKINLTVKDLMVKSPKKVIQELQENEKDNKVTYENFNKYIDRFIEVNKDRYNNIVTEATDYIIDQKAGYNDDEMFVSFSGGKDSTVVSDLVIKALGKPEIIHVFGDTTLEFPMTMVYANRFKKNNIRTPLLSAKNKEKNFYDLCDVIGPPSRVMRWCCIIFKTGAITKKISTIFKDKTKVLTFYGIRRSESVSRSKYDRTSDSPKITKQKVASPIIDWYDFDIWLYLLTTKIDFNDAYRLGYSRVGCWCCPNNSTWSQYLASIYMPEEHEKWRNQLIRFAKSVGKPDPEEYIDGGNWKARQGGNGVKYSEKTFVKFKPCAEEAEAINYELKKEITEELYEFFKPFGWVNKDMGNNRLGEVYIVDKNNNPIIRLQGRIGSKNLKISIIKLPFKCRSLKEAKSKVDCQITKYQMCLGCLACESVCKHDAVKVKKAAHENEIVFKTGESYKIYDDKCKRCGECVSHFDGGCYMRKVLITKRGE